MAKILIVDDDKTMLSFLKTALINEGHDVKAFDLASNALKHIEDNPIDLLLTDIVMPEMDGVELSMKANKIDPQIKIMFITGFAAGALKEQNPADIEKTVVSKPFHLKELIKNIDDILDM